AGMARRQRGVRERLEEASHMNRMQKTTVCLVFLDSCGCGPTPRIHLRAEHPGVRSMALESPPVKRDLVVTASVGARRALQSKGPIARRRQQSQGWFNGTSPIDPVLKAAQAHLWFVTVHPFDDGNGRIARAIADLALARSEQSPKRFYSMSSQIRNERNDYYDILERTQKNILDITPWMQWFLGCLDRAFDDAEATLASVLRKARFWEVHAGESFNDRQRKVVNRLLDGFEDKLTSSQWAKLAKCSQDTAHRDILDLIHHDILIKDSAGGRSTSYSLKQA